MICQHTVLGPTVRRARSTSSLYHLSYQVDFRDAESNGWRVYARFAFWGEAEACRNELQQRGFDTRLDETRPAVR